MAFFIDSLGQHSHYPTNLHPKYSCLSLSNTRGEYSLPIISRWLALRREMILKVELMTLAVLSDFLVVGFGLKTA